MNILKRNLAPLTDNAWGEINDTLKDILNTHQTARKFVDIDGPNGIDFGGVSTGRLTIPREQDKNGVNYGIREFLPLIEIRKPFELDMWEMDNIERGAKDVELTSLEDAGKEIALFEERAIYEGFQKAGIKGLREASEHDVIKLPDKIDSFLKEIGKQILNLQRESVEGPYALIINAQEWLRLVNLSQGYPVLKQLDDILGGQVLINHANKDSFLVSQRGEDFELVLGQDISIGYDHHDAEKVKLYLTSSFTFRVNSPEAIIVLESSK
ncbi:MAG: family 1 encapsulin nanocompartment shell protein [Bacteroidota bacterium]